MYRRCIEFEKGAGGGGFKRAQQILIVAKVVVDVVIAFVIVIDKCKRVKQQCYLSFDGK